LRLHGQVYAEWDRRDGGLGNDTLMGGGPRARLQNGKKFGALLKMLRAGLM
jgi:hypothetical protein